VGTQSGYRFTDGFSEAVPGGVRIANSAKIQLKDCTLHNMGGTGLELSYGDDNCTIDGCWISDIASTGIMVYTDTIVPNPSEEHQCRNDTISNCTIYRVGRDYTGAAAINATYPETITIDHNEVYDCPYVGISVGWGWTHNFTGLQDNRIRYNNVHDVMLLHDDAAGIYVMSNQQPPGTSGTKIEYNWVHDIHPSVWAEANPVAAIYLDNESDGIVVDHNVITRVDQIFNLNTPYPNTFTENESQDLSIIRTAGPTRRRVPIRRAIIPSRTVALGRPYLSSDTPLPSGGFIVSNNRKYFAILQTDGDFAVYHGEGPRPSGAVLWSTGTKRQAGTYRAMMQDDANFCLSQVDAKGKSVWMWDTRPLGPAGAYFVCVDDDGTLSIYHGTGPLDRGPKAWDSRGYREHTLQSTGKPS